MSILDEKIAVISLPSLEGTPRCQVRTKRHPCPLPAYWRLFLSRDCDPGCAGTHERSVLTCTAHKDHFSVRRSLFCLDCRLKVIITAIAAL
jgi:hypothetical protein